MKNLINFGWLFFSCKHVEKRCSSYLLTEWCGGTTVNFVKYKWWINNWSEETCKWRNSQCLMGFQPTKWGSRWISAKRKVEDYGRKWKFLTPIDEFKYRKSNNSNIKSRQITDSRTCPLMKLRTMKTKIQMMNRKKKAVKTPLHLYMEYWKNIRKS